MKCISDYTSGLIVRDDGYYGVIFPISYIKYLIMTTILNII